MEKKMASGLKTVHKRFVATAVTMPGKSPPRAAIKTVPMVSRYMGRPKRWAI